jgi:hypothetical protein
VEDGGKPKYQINENEMYSKSLSGKTDVLLYRKNRNTALDILSQLELKPPFGSLFQNDCSMYYGIEEVQPRYNQIEIC